LLLLLQEEKEEEKEEAEEKVVVVKEEVRVGWSWFALSWLQPYMCDPRARHSVCCDRFKYISSSFCYAICMVC
jgi:hypothetical protein